MDSCACRRFWKAAVALPALLLLVAGCASEASRSGDVGGRGEPTAADGNQPVTAPEFTLATVNGESFNLSETSGQVRLIDFWATWCAPCRDEIPMLNELQATYGDRGFRILAISDEEPGVIRDFVSEYEVTYTSLIGTEEVVEAYGVLGLPAAYLIDGEGRVVDSFLGPKPRKVLVEQIEALLEAQPST